MTKDLSSPAWVDDYRQWLAELKQRVERARQRAVASVNRELVALWQIGRDILDRQQKQGWGAGDEREWDDHHDDARAGQIQGHSGRGGPWELIVHDLQFAIRTGTGVRASLSAVSSALKQLLNILMAGNTTHM